MQARRPLTRQIVLEAALELVDRDGADALSMRKLGAELGVQAMSLYTHVASRDELLDGIAEVMVQRLGPRRKPRTWDAALRDFATSIRDSARAHPHAFRLVGMRPLRTPAALAPIEALLGRLRASGFSTPQAVAAYRLVAAYARGFALAELQGMTLEAPSADEERHPTIAAARRHPTALDHDRAFRLGLAAVTDGLRPYARRG